MSSNLMHTNQTNHQFKNSFLKKSALKRNSHSINCLLAQKKKNEVAEKNCTRATAAK